MSTYSIKLTPLRPEGVKRITTKGKAATRADAQKVALKAMPTCRLHDDEPTPAGG